MSKTKEKPVKVMSFNKALSLWAEMIYRRDGHQCAICGSRIRLNAHHLVSKTWRRYALLLVNGITLCAACHKYNRDHSPHYSLDSAAGFLDWLRSHRVEQYHWFETTRRNKEPVSRSFTKNLLKSITQKGFT